MPFRIRAITKEDESAWRGLWDQYNHFYERTPFPEEVTATTFARFLDDNVRMYAAVAEDVETNRMIGFVTWYPHPNTATIEEIVYLNDLFVDTTVRNHGAGRALIEHVCQHAKTIPATKVYWLTQHFNHRAQLLYTKVGKKSDFVHYTKDIQ